MNMHKMHFLIGIFMVLSFLLTSCGQVNLPSPQPQMDSPVPTLAPTPGYPDVVGPDPSYNVAAFYYPWYRSLEHDAEWIHWQEGGFSPPLDISSDFYPQLGAYSSLDPAVVAQHFAWLRESSVGVVVTSWWGQHSREDEVVPLLLEMGERYGIKVAFHIEPYGGRSAASLVSDIRYLYTRYGTQPAFYRSTTGSLWSSGEKQQGLFFIWAARYEDGESAPVEPSYWQQAMDEIHTMPEGGLVIADENGSEWVTAGHFDGSYKYGVLDSDMTEPYTWARALPPDAWYIPGVNPGFATSHIKGYEDATFTPRRDGAAYADRWQAMFDTGVEPEMVAITTFNEWHEGTQIEPAMPSEDNGRGYTYRDYESLPPNGYLMLTREWIDKYLVHDWPDARKVTIRMVTTSDWTFIELAGGATWMRPRIISASAEALYAGSDGTRFSLNQSLERAEVGKSVEMVMDILLSGMKAETPLVFEIGRGGIGMTSVEVTVDTTNGPVVVANFVWGGVASNMDNTQQFDVLAARVLDAGD